MNSVTLIGNVGQDPEVKTFDNGGKIASFSLATNKKYKKGNEVVTDTQWHRIVIVGGAVDVVKKYVKKGDKLAVQGELTHRKHQDTWYTDVRCLNVHLLGSPKGGESSAPDGDIPF